MVSREILYCILGNRELCRPFLRSVETLRDSGYAGPVRVVTDLDPRLEWDRRDVLDYEVVPLDRRHECTKYGGKTVINEYAAARDALVLDCDITVIGALDPVWEALDASDVALCLDMYPTVWQAVVSDLRKKPANLPADMRETVDACGTESPYYNSGVMAFRAGPRTQRLFSRWHCEWAKYKTSNQYALVRALKFAGITPAVLSAEFNADARAFADARDAVEKGVKILHFFGRGADAMHAF
jgi:hypothetical protein